MGNGRESEELHSTTRGIGMLAEDCAHGRHLPPALPPRPHHTGEIDNASPLSHHHGLSTTASTTGICSPCTRKYVLLCGVCGGLAVLLGGLFAILYFVLRSYTSSLHYFETVPSYVASVVLIVTGLLMVCFGWRRNRFGYLVKLCGACCFVCAVVCVVITVTTTVVHMNRLQSLRECVYNQRSKSCTCFAGPVVGSPSFPTENIEFTEDGGARYIFADTPDCDVVHGALYACLRALFGLSVLGILVSLFSGMLVYQLLGHERKKMYWEQLELRSRSLYRRHHTPCCGCCEQCRYPPPSNIFSCPPWDTLDDRFWPLQGGNLYSPAPETTLCRGHCHDSSQHPGAEGGRNPSPRRGGAWHWLPWRPSPNLHPENGANLSGNSSAQQQPREDSTTGPAIIGPDDHYGFPLSGSRNPLTTPTTSNRPTFPVLGTSAQPPQLGTATPLSWGPPPPYSRGSSASMSPAGSPAPFSTVSGSPAGLDANPLLCKTSYSHGRGSITSSDTNEDKRSSQQSPTIRPDQIGGGNTGTGTAGRKFKKRNPNYQGSLTKENLNTNSNGKPSLCDMMANANSLAEKALAAANQANNRQQPQQMPGGNAVAAKQPESELYFADVSSCALSVHNDGTESCMYEEISHRYEPVQDSIAIHRERDAAQSYVDRPRLPSNSSNSKKSVELGIITQAMMVSTHGKLNYQRHSFDQPYQDNIYMNNITNSDTDIPVHKETRSSSFSAMTAHPQQPFPPAARRQPVTLIEQFHLGHSSSNLYTNISNPPTPQRLPRLAILEEMHQQKPHERKPPAEVFTMGPVHVAQVHKNLVNNSSFVPYKRDYHSISPQEQDQTYANISQPEDPTPVHSKPLPQTNLDFDYQSPEVTRVDASRADSAWRESNFKGMSPDDEVAALTSQFDEAPIELESDSDDSECDSTIRAVNV